MGANMPTGSKHRLSGFSYLGLLMVITIAGIGMAGVGIVWHHDAEREREKELLFIGDEFRKAIGSYYESSPSDTKQYPTILEELIIDKRFPATKRHLRKLYADPFTQNKPWGLVLQQGKIVGIYSQSHKKPIKKTGFPTQYETFGEAAEYSEWKFVYIPGSAHLTPLVSNSAI
jgi:type II secretory pathway pseudopilin PulG